MRARKLLRLLGAALSPAVFGFVVLSSLAVYVKEQTSAGFYGVVTLRSYFECGTGRFPDPDIPGDKGDPYVITRPRHLYNLSRLQGLGVFGKKLFFQLGKAGLNPEDDTDTPYCYTSDIGTETAKYLDMSSTNSNWNKNRINAIGSEAYPFYGVFDGQNVEIRGLNVYADPQDAGLFGYTAHDSVVKNLFLSDITIHSLGYDDAHKELYGKTAEVISPELTIQTDLLQKLEPSITLSNGNSTITTYLPTTQGTPEEAKIDYQVSGWTATSFTNPTSINVSYNIGTTKAFKNNYRYEFLCSGDLVKKTSGVVSLDLAELLKYFKGERDKNSYPIRAASTVSLIASTTDSDGIDHSRVLMAVDFVFTLQNKEDTKIKMRPEVADDHGNNIGLIIGHCDGSVSDCYVYNGAFKMNQQAGYYPLAHRSAQGLIGLTGNTVHNIAADDAGAATGIGKSIGVLDFTKVYDAIIDENSFSNANSQDYPSTSNKQAVTFKPKTGSDEYQPFLRSFGSGSSKTYITHDTNEISFRQKRVIQKDELGVFTVATDSVGVGDETDVLANLTKSTIKKDNVDYSGDYYVYYATGEYDREKATAAGLTYDQYYSSFVTDNPTQFFTGHYLPQATEVTKESMGKREMHQNYFFRFKVDADYREEDEGYYFSDVDRDTAGGSFVSKYFSSKLIGQSQVAIQEGTSKCGVMLRYREGDEVKEVDSFHASFATPDYSGGGKIDTIQSAEYKYPAANMINFKITTPTANVTVVAAPDTANKPAALGIYRYGPSDGGTDYTDNTKSKIDKTFKQPDYAFFMPKNDQLAYFDYKVCAVDPNTHQEVTNEYAEEHELPVKGRIGTYKNVNNVFTFTEADNTTLATMPTYEGVSSEFAKRSDDKRLFAHTFKLKEGTYCLGSASGGGNYTTAKVYYICAQGQDEGDLQDEVNSFASGDKVEKIDFLKRARFGDTDEITFNTVTTYDATDPNLENQRCYIQLSDQDHSRFLADSSDITFKYENGKFKITTTTQSAIKKIVVANFGKEYGLTRKINEVLSPITGLNNTTVQLITADDKTNDLLVWPITTTTTSSSI